MSYQSSYISSSNTSARTSGNITSVVVPTGGSVIVFGLWDGSVGTPGVSSAGMGGTWEEITNVAQNNTGGLGYWQRAWINRTPTPGTYTVTITHGNGYDVLKAFVQTEVPTSGALSTVLASSFNYQPTAPTGADGVTSGTMTPPDTPWLLYGVSADWSATGAPAAGTGFTDLNLNGLYSGSAFTEAEYRTGTGTTAVAATFARAAASSHLTTGILVIQVAAGGTEYTQDVTASGTGTLAVTVQRIFNRAYTPSAAGSAAYSKQLAAVREYTPAGVGTSSYSKQLSAFRSLAPSATGTLVVSRAAQYFRQLAASASGALSTIVSLVGDAFGSVDYLLGSGGTYDYGRLTTLPDGFGDGEFTLEIRIRPSNISTIGQTSTGSGIYTNWANENATLYAGADWWYYGNFLIDGHNNATVQNGTFSLQIYNSGQSVRWTFGDPASGARVGDLHGIQGNAPATLLDDAWHTIACVRRWDGGTGAILELWVDGTLVDTETSTSRANMATTYWDTWSDMEDAGTGQSGWFFGAEKFAALTGPDWADYKGLVSALAFWSMAKSSSELTNDWQTAPVGNETGLVGLYRHDEGSGTTVADSLASGGDITLVNSPGWSTDSPFSISEFISAAMSGVGTALVNVMLVLSNAATPSASGTATSSLQVVLSSVAGAAATGTAAVSRAISKSVDFAGTAAASVTRAITKTVSATASGTASLVASSVQYVSGTFSAIGTMLSSRTFIPQPTGELLSAARRAMFRFFGRR